MFRRRNRSHDVPATPDCRYRLDAIR